jgi:hypothetical protein
MLSRFEFNLCDIRDGTSTELFDLGRSESSLSEKESQRIGVEHLIVVTSRMNQVPQPTTKEQASDELMGCHCLGAHKIFVDHNAEVRDRYAEDSVKPQNAPTFFRKLERALEGEMLKGVGRVDAVYGAIGKWKSFKDVVPPDIVRPVWNMQELSCEREAGQPDGWRVVQILPSPSARSAATDVQLHSERIAYWTQSGLCCCHDAYRWFHTSNKTRQGQSAHWKQHSLTSCLTRLGILCVPDRRVKTALNTWRSHHCRWHHHRGGVPSCW